MSLKFSSLFKQLLSFYFSFTELIVSAGGFCTEFVLYGVMKQFLNLYLFLIDPTCKYGVIVLLYQFKCFSSNPKLTFLPPPLPSPSLHISSLITSYEMYFLFATHVYAWTYTNVIMFLLDFLTRMLKVLNDFLIIYAELPAVFKYKWVLVDYHVGGFY